MCNRKMTLDNGNDISATIDHVVSKNKIKTELDGLYIPKNLKAACLRCNQRKGSA